MSIRLLVLHGPNVPLRLEKEASTTLSALHRSLKQRAKELGATLRTATVHGEEGLLAALWEQRDWANGVLLASGHLAGTPTVSEALALLGIPSLELSATKRGQAQNLDENSYLDGLAKLCAQLSGAGAKTSSAGAKTSSAGAKTSSAGVKTSSAGAKTPSAGAKTPSAGVKSPSALAKTSSVKTLGAKRTSGNAAPASVKTLGRRAAAKEDVATPTAKAAPIGAAKSSQPATTKTLGRARTAESSAASPGKTLGRRPASAGAKGAVSARGTSLHGLPTREAARAQLAARLSGTLDATALRSWAREGWSRLEAEQSPDTRLSAVLLRLTAGANLNDDQLITLMTELDR